MKEISKVKLNDKIKYKDKVYEVLKTTFSKTGRQGAVLRTRMKDLATGNVAEFTFRDSDKLESADLNREKAQFLYKDDNEFHFMNLNNYEQFSLNKEVIGDMANFLIEEANVVILFIEGEPVNIDFSVKMDFKVVEAPPATKGNTVDGGTKKVKIETGYYVDVPLFIKENDTIKINTEDGKYAERVS